jgi:hypothetical protein
MLRSMRQANNSSTEQPEKLHRTMGSCFGYHTAAAEEDIPAEDTLAGDNPEEDNPEEGTLGELQGESSTIRLRKSEKANSNSQRSATVINTRLKLARR